VRHDYPIPAVKILFVTNVIADFDMPATSSGTAAVRFTPVGADSSLRAPLPVQQGGRTATNDLVGESNVLGYRGSRQLIIELRHHATRPDPFRDPASAGGRYWVRTSDLFGVNEARYHCANRPLAVRPEL